MTISQPQDRNREDFVWKDGERLIAYGPSALASLPAFLRAAGMEEFVAVATDRSASQAPDVIGMAVETVFAGEGRVDAIAADLLEQVGDRPVVAVGGGRVVDAAKALGGATGKPVGVVPTTLSGAPMTPFHRLPAGFDGPLKHVRPMVVIAVPDLMASQPVDLRTGSAMNALAHAVESIFVTTSSAVPRLAARGAIELLYGGLVGRGIGPEPESRGAETLRRAKLALGAIEAGYAVGSTGYAIHHVICQTVVRVAEVPHAPTYGVMLPFTLEFLKIRDAIAWEMVAEAIGEDDPSTAIARVNAEAGLPTSLSALGVAPERIDSIVAAAESRAELKLTPGGADADDIRSLLDAAF
ncbi:MAG: iron-containing alcohol dehydrogenase [Solirubrobacterales bacterium]